VHVSYCHSPMRYAWDQFESYFGEAQVGRARNRVLRPIMAAMARWDRRTAGRVDRFVANSHYVAARIRRYYNRGSTVVYPPVDTDFYRPAENARPRSGFLVVSALVPYKKLELAIDACRTLGAPLTVVGTGLELARLKSSAGPGVEFLGWRSDEEIRDLYRSAEAALLPGVEDFGMVPVEAQACGCPVVAYAEGGAAETVTDDETGALVGTPTAAAFADALRRIRARRFDTDRLRAHALRFSREQFLEGFRGAVDAATNRTPSRPAARRTQPPPPAAREDAASRTQAQPQAAREDEQ
jgi:glycosyltransferase involved in cell wall biosynthesis